MYMYFTAGTRDFMEKLRERHANKGMILMHGGGQSLLVHESDSKKSLFQTPRRYEVIGSVGKFGRRRLFRLQQRPCHR